MWLGIKILHELPGKPMINSIKINSDLHNFDYIKDIENFPKEINFTPGVNIIIGENGSGKSTILNIK